MLKSIRNSLIATSLLYVVLGLVLLLMPGLSLGFACLLIGGSVLVSLGGRGCCLVGADALGPAELLPLTLGARAELYAPAPKGRTVNPVGSGDSFLAAYLYAALRGWPDREALSLANAAGAANAQMFPAARVGWKEIGPLLRGMDRKN